MATLADNVDDSRCRNRFRRHDRLEKSYVAASAVCAAIGDVP
jgi:hypothetical protein